VELRVALDESAGTARLTWSTYHGELPLVEYRVLRRVAERTRVETLAVLTNPSTTAYVDSLLAPDTPYVYRVAVVSAGGLEASSAEHGLAPYRVQAVDLLPVRQDAETGSVRVVWRPYQGPRFVRYRIHRRQVGTDADSLLATHAHPADTSFADTTARHGLDYVFRVVTVAAGETLTSAAAETRLELPGVTPRVTMSSAEGHAALTWPAYTGPRFAGYHVRRQAPGEPLTTIAELLEDTDTSFTDSEVHGNVTYTYQVAVVTRWDEEVLGSGAAGEFHELVDVFALVDRTGVPFVRLSTEADGSILVLTTQGLSGWGPLTLNTAGPRVDATEWHESAIPNRSVATALQPDGRRVFSQVNLEAKAGYVGEVALFRYDGPGQPVLREHRLFADAFTASLQGDEAIVLGEIALECDKGEAAFDDVAVWTGEDLVAEDRFTEGLTLPWQLERLATQSGWLYQGNVVGGNPLSFLGLWDARAVARDPSWTGFRLEVDVSRGLADGITGIWVGGDTYSRVALRLDRVTREARLDWTFSPPAGVGGALPQEAHFAEPFIAMGSAIAPYHLSLGVEDGQIDARVVTPVYWSAVHESSSPWASLASLGESLILTADDQAFTIDTDGQGIRHAALPGDVSETRVWKPQDSRATWVAVCLPERNQVWRGSAFRGEFPRLFSRWLGSELGGSDDGRFSFPISFAVAPDGRAYVLDAGNARVQVFDADGVYLTQWGTRGSGEGQFNFGLGLRGSEGLDLRGSIAVDDDGYIYVADVGNQRIQKFAP